MKWRDDQFRSSTSHQFAGQNVWQLLLSRSATSADRPFVVWHPFTGNGRTLTYGELTREAASVAAGLVRRGVGVGDKVLIYLENCPEFLVSWFACAAIGAVAVTVNSRSAGDELAYFADDCGAVAGITQPRFAELLGASAKGLRWLVSIDHNAGEPADAATQLDADSRFSSLRADPNELEALTPDPFAPMSVQYTSGTTSRPKGVLWTHANALWGARVNAAHEDLHPDDCHLVYMPLYHTNALAYSMLACLWVGARFVLVPKWSSSRFWGLSARYGCTWMSLIRTAQTVISETEEIPTNSYRLFGTGTCDWAPSERLGVKTIGWWGMTETISHGILGDPFQRNRRLSMGRPAPEYGIAVVRDDGVTPVEADETGSLLVRGTVGLSLFGGYLGRPKVTAEAFDESGWFRTGDRVTPHADGYISFADRATDLMRVGGENVAASEVERVILGIPGVEEAAVVGRADDRLDEVPVAFVVAPGAPPGVAERIRQECDEKLADFKVPRAVHVVADLPRSNLRKVNRAELRKVASVDADRKGAETRWLESTESDPLADAP